MNDFYVEVDTAALWSPQPDDGNPAQLRRSVAPRDLWAMIDSLVALRAVA